MRNGYGHMMIDHTVTRFRKEAEARNQKLSACRTKEDALAYRDRARQIIRKAFGPLPDRTPLNPRITGRIEAEGYVIEKILFESRPGFVVSANLYLPDSTEKVPCVLGTCGHAAEGKAAPLYQSFCLRLVDAGFAVLIYDPINQGERDQYALLDDRSLVKQSTHAHNMMGKQLELVEEGFYSWRAWDGIRALDYLLSRPEVDTARVGLTGNSGGGTMSTWLWALDDRFTMGAPSCFVTTFSRNLENELPADAEQYPYGVVGQGLDMADFIISGAPKPILILGQQYDFFDPRGHQQAVDETVDFYRLLGAPEGVAAGYRGPHAHGYWIENQREMVQFFVRHAGLEDVAFLEDPDVLPVEELWATTQGNVVLDGSTPIYELISEKASALASTRQSLTDTGIRSVLQKLLGVVSVNDGAEYRHLAPTNLGGKRYGRFAVETEGSIRALLYKSMRVPDLAHTLDVEGDVTVYLPHLSVEKALLEDSWARELQLENELYALDVRGLGESMPDEEGDFWAAYGMDYMMHGQGILLGESYLGRRVHDVLVTVDLLLKLGARSVNLAGNGQGAIHALLAASLDERVSSVAVSGCPVSWQSWAETAIVRWSAACCPRGILKHLDILDLLGVLGERVTVRSSWGPEMGK